MTDTLRKGTIAILEEKLETLLAQYQQNPKGFKDAELVIQYASQYKELTGDFYRRKYEN